MADRSRDVKIRILSQYYDEGSRAAERATRRLANLQAAAGREDIAREAQRAAAVVKANRDQAIAMETFGRRTLAVSAAIAVGLGLSAKAAIDWESDWAGVLKTVDGSPEQLQALQDELRGLAKVLPASHTEIARVAEAAGQLGVKQQDVASFTRTMIDMGETTNLTADEAATSMAQFSNIMGVGADQASELGSSIVALGNNSATTERDILAMGLRIAGAGRTVGLTSDQVLALSAGLASVGIPAEAGGTAISRVMLQIDKDVAGGTSRIKDYARVAGVSAQEFATRWEDDAAGALTMFTSGLGTMQEEGENTSAVLDEMGFSQIRVSDTLRRSALAGDLMTESLETSAIAWAENNALAEEAAKRYETTEAKLQIARNQINDAAIDIGGNFLPALAGAAEGVGALAAGFGALSPQQQTWVASLGAGAAGLTALVGGAAIVIPKLKELSDTVTALRGGQSRLGKAIGGTASALAGPLGLALSGATIAVGLWMKAQGEAAQMTQALAGTLDEQTGALTENSTAWIASELTKDQSFGVNNTKSMAEAAKEMGISLELLTRAYEGQPDAIAEAKDAAQAWADEQRGSFDIMAGADSVMTRFNRNLDDQAGRLEDAKEITAAKADIDKVATGTQEDFNTEVAVGNDLIDEASSALDELTKAMDELNAPVLNARDAEREWHSQIKEVNDALEDTEEELLANGKALDVTTEKGRANQEVLDGLARSGAKRAETVLEETGSIEKYTESLEASRDELYRNARQFGLTEDEAEKYVDQVLAIPDTATTQAEFDDAKARDRIAKLKAALAMPTIRIGVDVPRTGYYADRAHGGITEFYANGGMRREHHLAQIVPAGTNRVWAEPETGGEAYIPMGAGSKRPRAEEILGEVARRFGGAYITRTDQLAAVTGRALGQDASAPAAIGGPSMPPAVHLHGIPADRTQEFASATIVAIKALQRGSAYSRRS